MKSIFVIENFVKPLRGHNPVRYDKGVDRLGPSFDNYLMATVYLESCGFNLVVEEGEKPRYQRVDGSLSYKAYIREIRFYGPESF